jgi:nucleotide-binding universal stress UspA family protein
MPRISKILFPVDFSEHCGRVAASVDSLAKHFKARLTLLHSIGTAPITQIAYPMRLYAALCKELRETSTFAMEEFI